MTRITSIDTGYATLLAQYNAGKDLIYDNRKWRQIYDSAHVFVDVGIADLFAELGDPSGAGYPSVAARQAEVINVKDYGAKGDGTTNDTVACAAALAAAGTKCVYFPQGTYRTTLVFTGLRCTMRGDGDSTIIKAPTGTAGPVIDMTGYLYAESVESSRVFSDFRVEHDGTAGAAKKGIYAPSLGAVIFRNISIADTGGRCLDIPGTQLAYFENITLNMPVSAKANDIAYLYGSGATNGNRFIGLGLRSVSASADVGASGAVILEDNGVYTPELNTFIGTWVEYLHPPTNGTIFAIKGNTNSFNDTQFFDCSKESGATGTSHFRFDVPGIANQGGNIVTGEISGKDSTDALSIDCGIDMRQSRNRVVGVKGYKGTNVILASGITNTLVELGGSRSGATDAAVTDNSGQTSNVIIDHVLKTQQLGTFILDDGAATADGPRIQKVGFNQAGGLTLGSNNVRIQAVTGVSNLYLTANGYIFRNIALNAIPLTLWGGAGDSAAKIVANAGYPAVEITGGEIEMSEISDPAAPASNKARLFTRDNGSGKTQVCVRFPTGAVQVVATEP